jgi:hypothetical protein
MSKKSRRRNKKILGLLAAGLGATALMRGRGTAAANVDSGRGGDSSSAAARVAANTAPAVTGTNYPGANKVVTAPAKKSSWPYRSSRGIGDYGVVTAPTRVNGVQIKGRQNAQPITPFHPSQGNKRRTMAQVLSGGDTRGWKSGGRVTGIAKRGFGRALKKK